jgi:hypothetical protein
VARTVTTVDHTYVVVDDRRLTWQALVTGRVRDELVPGRPVSDPIGIDATLRGVQGGPPDRFAVTTPGGGLWALSGVPDDALPDLATTTRFVDLVVRVPGYLPVPVAIELLAGTALPFAAAPVDLRRPGLRLAGRITGGTPPAGLAGALVEVTSTANLVAVDPPLALAHPLGTSVTRCTLTTVLAAPLALTADVDAGDVRVPLARRTGLGPDEVLRLGEGGPDPEYAVVAALEGSADLTRPGVALLRAPLGTRHRRADGPAHRVIVTPSAATTTLGRAGVPGDTVLPLASVAPLPDSSACRVDDPPGGRQEYRVSRHPQATTDAGGYWRLPPVGAATSVTVTVTPAGGAPVAFPAVPLPYERPDEPFNLRV